MKTLDFGSLIGDKNVFAFDCVVAAGESHETEEWSWRVRYHPEKRTLVPDLYGGHPRIFEPTPAGELSSAFGRYQVTWTTWKWIIDTYGLPNSISVWNQKCVFVALLNECGALQHVIDGEFEEALQRAGRWWASLPTSTLDDGHVHRYTFAKAREVWERNGGMVPVRVAGPAPIEEVKDPDGDGKPGIPAYNPPPDSEFPHVLYVKPQQPKEKEMPVIAVLLQSLFAIFSPVLAGKLNKTLDKVTEDPALSKSTTDQLIDLLRQVVGVPPAPVPVQPNGRPASAVEIEAAKVMEVSKLVEAIKNDPAKAKLAEAKFEDWMTSMLPAFDAMEKYQAAAWDAEERSRAAALDRALKMQESGPLRGNATFLIAAFVLFLVGGVVGTVLWKGGFSTDMQAMVIGAVVGTAFTAVLSFFFGSSRSSAAKDAIMGELAARRPIKEVV